MSMRSGIIRHKQCAVTDRPTKESLHSVTLYSRLHVHDMIHVQYFRLQFLRATAVPAGAAESAY